MKFLIIILFSTVLAIQASHSSKDINGKIAEVQVKGKTEKLLLDSDGKLLAILDAGSRVLIENLDNSDINSASKTAKNVVGKLVITDDNYVNFVDPTTGDSYNISSVSNDFEEFVKGFIMGAYN